jgi:hypothetical protein
MAIFTKTDEKNYKRNDSITMIKSNDKVNDNTQAKIDNIQK